MVYESDFYTTRRPYSRPSPTITSYSVTRRQVDWSKVPTVPRPSQVPDPVTIFGRRPDPPGTGLSGINPHIYNAPARSHHRYCFQSGTAHY